MASSRKEEERNEKIIRGLMKLPPNRRCINCNSLGPQYVCTNFWTFICMTCSGIHREFTHRVKSVSMSKFTSQEVEALQNGGNQRAKEIYLKSWDHQRQRLPDISNVDKVREFIKNVYVDKKYFGGKNSDVPPKDKQTLRGHEDESRRASSYHSYSQSPPYDFQYEERKYGKQAPVLTRKPGSDRGLFAGKMSSFICSPTHASGRTIEDRFANERSFSRGSDFSVSSGGDVTRSGTESPNFQKDIRFSSPPAQTTRDILGGHVQHQRADSDDDLKKHVNRIPRPQRTSSLGSFGSFDSNSMSFKSYNSGSFMDVISEPELAAGTHLEKSSSFPHSSFSVNHGSLNLFEAPAIPQSGSSTVAPVDLFQLPAAQQAPNVNLFEESMSQPASSVDSHQPAQHHLPSSLDLFGEIVQQEAVTTLDAQLTQPSVPKNEGWATFDKLQPIPSTQRSEDLKLGVETHTTSVVASRDESLPELDKDTSVDTSTQWAAFQDYIDPVSSLPKLDKDTSFNTSMQWPAFQGYTDPMSSFVSDPWHNNLQNGLPNNISSAQEWDAFHNSVTTFPGDNNNKQSVEAKMLCNSSMPANPSLGYVVSEDPRKNEIQKDASYAGLPPNGQSLIFVQPQYSSSSSLLEGTESHASNNRTTNPFDSPYDSELEQGDMFMDMSSLQAALPGNDLPTAFYGGIAQPWFSQDPLTTYIPSSPQGGLACVAEQTPTAQLANVQTQGHIASIGGNPFA